MWIILAMPIFWGTAEVESRGSLQAKEREVHAVFLRAQYNDVGCRLLWRHDPSSSSSIIPCIPISPFKPALINVSSRLILLLSSTSMMNFLWASNVRGQTASFRAMVSFINWSTSRLSFLCLTNLTSPPIGWYASGEYASGDGFHFFTDKVYWDL